MREGEDIDETSDQMIGLSQAYAFEPVIASPDEHSINEDSNSFISSESDSQVSEREPEKGQDSTISPGVTVVTAQLIP